MKPEKRGVRLPVSGAPAAPVAPLPTGHSFGLLPVYALGFGLFLGLAILKFGNPVILDQKIPPPHTAPEIWHYAWPLHWAWWFFIPLLLAGVGLVMQFKPAWPGTPWLWVLPCVWMLWQGVAATQTVDRQLTQLAVSHFAGCTACYFLGALVLGKRRVLPWLFMGLLAAFTYCLIRAADQKWIEFPQERQALLEGQQAGWTNFSSAAVLQMQQEGVIITTNGVEAANPVILAKYAKGRVNGTLVYPNALAGLVLLLFPVSLVLAMRDTRPFRISTRAAVIGMTVFLGAGGLFWTGSKLGWLIALVLAGIWLLRLDWPVRWKCAVVAAVFAAGLGLFAIRFHHYFAAGATSVGARFDYWRAAVRITGEHPLVGTGPGTFQRPYARIKAPESEMARLTHNDYLEQFCDSGVPGGLAYAAWITLALVQAGRRLWRTADPLLFPIFLGLSGWYFQGLAEFSLYVPALAWTAFALLGCVTAFAGDSPSANAIDKAAGEH